VDDAGINFDYRRRGILTRENGQQGGNGRETTHRSNIRVRSRQSPAAALPDMPGGEEIQLRQFLP
jgi:hypothetical protein